MNSFFIGLRTEKGVLSVYEYAIAQFLASMCYGDKLECWPSISSIAAALNISDSTVKRALKGLVEKNIITKTERNGKSLIFRFVENFKTKSKCKEDTANQVDNKQEPSSERTGAGNCVGNIPSSERTTKNKTNNKKIEVISTSTDLARLCRVDEPVLEILNSIDSSKRDFNVVIKNIKKYYAIIKSKPNHEYYIRSENKYVTGAEIIRIIEGYTKLDWETIIVQILANPPKFKYFGYFVKVFYEGVMKIPCVNYSESGGERKELYGPTIAQITGKSKSEAVYKSTKNDFCSMKKRAYNMEELLRAAKVN